MFTKPNELVVLSLFFRFPNSVFHLREVVRQTKLSLGGVQKILQRLVKEKLLIRKKTIAKTDFLANAENPEFMRLKQAFNLYALRKSGLIEHLVEKYAPDAIILFGSYLRGEDTENSDIDIAILSKKELSLNMEQFERSLHRTINTHHVDIKSATPEFKNNLINGITLYGYLRLFS